MTFHWVVAAFIFLQQERSHFRFQLGEIRRAAGAKEEAALPLCLGKDSFHYGREKSRF